MGLSENRPLPFPVVSCWSHLRPLTAFICVGTENPSHGPSFFFFFLLMEYKQKWSALKKIIRKESWKFLCKRSWLTTQSVSHFRSVSVSPSKVDLGVFLVLGTAKSMYASCPKGRGEKLFLTSLLGLSVQGFTQEVTWKGLWIPFTVHSDLMITVDWTYKICSAGNSPCSVAV